MEGTHVVFEHESLLDLVLNVEGTGYTKSIDGMANTVSGYSMMDDSVGNPWLVKELGSEEEIMAALFQRNSDSSNYSPNIYQFTPENGVIPPSVPIEP